MSQIFSCPIDQHFSTKLESLIITIFTWCCQVLGRDAKFISFLFKILDGIHFFFKKPKSDQINFASRLEFLDANFLPRSQYKTNQIYLAS